MTTQQSFVFDGLTERMSLPPVEAKYLRASQDAEWAQKNPIVVAEFNRRALLALEASHRGERHKSAKGITEDIREADFQMNGRPFAIDNNLTPMLSRLAMKMEPRLAGYFETRLTSQEKTS